MASSSRHPNGGLADGQLMPRQQCLPYSLSHDASDTDPMYIVQRRRRNLPDSATFRHINFVNLDQVPLHPPDNGASPFKPTFRQRRTTGTRRDHTASHDLPPLPARQHASLATNSRNDQLLTNSYLLDQQFRGLRKTLYRAADAAREHSHRRRRATEHMGISEAEAQEQQAIVEGLLRNSFHSLAPPPRIVSGMEEVRQRSSRGGR